VPIIRCLGIHRNRLPHPFRHVPVRGLNHDLIRELAEDATVLISTHILQEVEATCDRVLIIRNDRLALDSRPTST